MELLLDVLAGWIAIFFANLTAAMVGNFLALMVIGFIGFSLVKMHRDPNHRFDITELFIDKNTGRIGGSEFRMNSAFFVTSWALVYSILKNQSVEIVFGGYLTAWVLDRYNSRNASLKSKDQVLNEGTQ